MTNSVSQSQRLLAIIFVVFLVVDIAAAIVLISPIGRPSSQRGAEYEKLRIERQQKEAETIPTANMDKKLETASAQIADFYAKRLPNNYSEISESLDRLAQEHHVVLSAVKYDPHPTTINGLNSIGVTLSLTGDYAAEMNFMNAIEREKKFYVVDRVLIGPTENNKVRVDLQLETFLRNTA